MAYALIKGGAVAAYPYSFTQLRRDNPKTSFPKRPGDDMLGSWGMHRVAQTYRPEANHTKNVVEIDPVLLDGVWTQVWETTDATVEEIAERTKQAANGVREKRSNLLADSDWRVIKSQETGVAMSPEWVSYRLALRDITSHPNFPHLKEEDWPVSPG